MALDKTIALRQLVPKSYHFDGYNELNCPNSRDKPFFSDNTIAMGEFSLQTSLLNSQTLSLQFTSVCGFGDIIFSPYKITITEFVEKIKQAIKDKSDFITFSIPVNYPINTSHVRDCFFCGIGNKACHHIKKNHPTKLMAAISFYPNDMKEALSVYYEINNQNQGGTTMKTNKNLFGMNFECGLNKDPNLKSTMLGISVRNSDTGSWYIFDPATGTRKNMSKIKFGDFPIMLLPVKVLAIGDLIKMNRKYYYVLKTGTGKTIKLIGAADGEVREVYPEESFIPGMSMYTKVFAFDAKTLTDPTSNQGLGGNIMAALCLAKMSKGDESEFSLDDINDDSFNGLGKYLPFLMASKGNNWSAGFNNPDGTPNIGMILMMFGDSGTDDLTQAILMSQMLGGANGIADIFGGMTAIPASPSGNTTNKVKCPFCGTEYDDESVLFCAKCGNKTEKILPPGTYCKKCGTQLKEGAAFCHACGTKAGPVTCPKCGKPYDSSDAFCSGCGTSLKTPVSTTPVVPTVTPVPAPAIEPTPAPDVPTTDAPTTT